MSIQFFGDADSYLRLGASCAQGLQESDIFKSCYNGLRPIGAALYFALAPLLSDDPVTILYVQVALNVLAFLLLLRGMTLCVDRAPVAQGWAPLAIVRGPLLVSTLALAMPYLPVPLSDLPAVAFFMIGLAVLVEPSASMKRMVVAGACMGVSCLVKQNYFAFAAFAFAAMVFGPWDLREKRTWTRFGAAAAGACVALLQPAWVWMHTGHFWPFNPADGAVFEEVRRPNVVELVAYTLPQVGAYISTLDTMDASGLSQFCVKLLQGFYAFRPAVYLGAPPAGSPTVMALTSQVLLKAYLGAGLLVGAHVTAGIVSPRQWRPVVVLSLASTLFSAWIIHVENRYFLLSKLLVVWWAFGWAGPALVQRFAASAAAAGVWRSRATHLHSNGLAPWRVSPAAVMAYGTVLAVCFLLFLDVDLLRTVGSSYAYLHGHGKDFYEFNRSVVGHSDSLPGIYVVLALWYWPLKAVGALTGVAGKGGVTLLGPLEPFWGKLLLALLFVAAVELVRRVGTLASGQRNAGWRAAAVFATAPLAVFPVFVMGQSDIVPVLLVVAALYAYFQLRFWWFAVLFSLAIPFGYLPITFFAPLVLLAPVAWTRRIQLSVVALAVTALQVALYWHRKAFPDVLSASWVHASPGIGAGVAAVGFLLVCVWCARRSARSSEQWTRHAILACALTAALLFTGIDWRPQSLLVAIPFFALASMDLRRPALWFGAEVVMAVAFGWLVANRFAGAVDVAMVRQGAFAGLFPRLFVTNADLLGASVVPLMALLFTACLFIPAVLMVLDGGALAVPERYRAADTWIAGRFYLAMAVLLVPTLYCMFATEADSAQGRLQTKFASWPSSLRAMHGTRTAGELLPGRTVSEQVVAPRNGLRAVGVRFATYARSNAGQVHIVVQDGSGVELAAETVQAARLRDNQNYVIAIPRQSNSAGRSYMVTVAATDTRQGLAPTVWIADDAAPGAKQLRIDGKNEPGALDLQLLHGPYADGGGTTQ